MHNTLPKPEHGPAAGAPPRDREYDCIVLGAGGVGSGALYHLARRGARALGLDRFPPPHDRGSSHGETRIIRLAYFEHADYVPLLRRAYELWKELEEETGKELYLETGLLQVGPPGGAVVPGLRRAASGHGLELEELGAGEVEARFAGFRVPPSMVGMFERRAGALRVEECVRAHLDAARRRGAELRIEEARGFRFAGGGVEVETEGGLHRARSLIVAPGAWAPGVLRDLGLRLQVRRKALLWYEAEAGAYRAEHGSPAFLYEMPAGIFYGFPDFGGGVKVGEHTGGEAVADPLSVDRGLRREEREIVESFLAAQLPRVTPRLHKHVVCLYTMTPDEHFVVDRHPRHPQVAFAAGLSGHGFKFTSVLGEALADLALDGKTRLPIGFLSCRRKGLS
jgi:monomeric sarcosine oxidase